MNKEKIRKKERVIDVLNDQELVQLSSPARLVKLLTMVNTEANFYWFWQNWTASNKKGFWYTFICEINKPNWSHIGVVGITFILAYEK